MVLSAVTDTAADVVTFPASSVARAVTERAPVPVDVHVADHGAALSLATTAPSTRNSTLSTRRSSPADAVNWTAPRTVAPAEGPVTDTRGARTAPLSVNSTTSFGR